MARPAARKLPSVAVEETSIRARVNLSQALHAELESYARYWSSATGRKPRSLDDLMSAVLTEYLTSDALFQKWQRDHRGDGARDRSALIRRFARRSL
jgi:hypothetical protein